MTFKGRVRQPTTKDGLTKIVLDVLKDNDTAYFSFCKELEEHGGNRKEMRAFCENLCQIHKHAHANALFCIPYSTKKLLENGQG